MEHNNNMTLTMHSHPHGERPGDAKAPTPAPMPAPTPKDTCSDSKLTWQAALALSVLVLSLTSGIAISSLCAPSNSSSDSTALLTAGSSHNDHWPMQLHGDRLHKRLPPPPIRTHSPSPDPVPTPPASHRRSSSGPANSQASTEYQPHPLHQHQRQPSSHSATSSNASTAPHPLDTCAAYDDLNLLTRESTAYYAARGGLSRRDFATAVRDCELRNYECVRFQIVHGVVYAVHPVPAAFQSRTLATLLLLQTLADRATARWKRQVDQLSLLPSANLSATWGPNWPYLAPHAHQGNERAGTAAAGLPANWPAWLPPYPVPNMDAMLHDGDYHHTEAHYWTYSRPVGVHHGWVMPEYALAGWPEAGLATWIEAHTTLTRLADTVPWASKNSTLVWRGTNLITLRAQLLRAAPYFEPKGWFDIKSSPAGAKDAYMTMAEQCGKFKYLLYTEGYAQSGRLKYQLSCGSLIISHPPVYREYWTPLLKNGVHWVVLKDTDWTRVPGVMAQVRKADQEAEARKRNATIAGGDTHGKETRAVVLEKPRLLSPMPDAEAGETESTANTNGDDFSSASTSASPRTFTPEQMAHNAAQFARRVFSQDAMSCQAQAAMWAYRRSINWNQFTNSGSHNKREDAAGTPPSIRPHPNAVPIKQLVREVMGQWIEFSGGKIRRRRAYHKEHVVPKRPGSGAGGMHGSKVSHGSDGFTDGDEELHLDVVSPRKETRTGDSGRR